MVHASARLGLQESWYHVKSTSLYWLRLLEQQFCKEVIKNIYHFYRLRGGCPTFTVNRGTMQSHCRELFGKSAIETLERMRKRSLLVTNCYNLQPTSSIPTLHY